MVPLEVDPVLDDEEEEGEEPPETIDVDDDGDRDDLDVFDVVVADCAARAAIPPASAMNAAIESAAAAMRDRAAAWRRRTVLLAGRRSVARHACGVACGPRVSMSSLLRSLDRLIDDVAEQPVRGD